MGLACMNCKSSDFPPSDGRLFAEAYVCPDCFLVATRLYEQGERELRQVQMTLKELIRISIMDGRLSFAPAPEGAGEDVQPRRAIDAIADMMREKTCRDETSRPTTASGAPTKGAAGPQSKESTLESASKSGIPFPALMGGGSDNA